MVGPGKEGAQLEGSKDFSKQFMLRHQIPTAKARTFQAHETEEALQYLEYMYTSHRIKSRWIGCRKRGDHHR